MTPETRLPIFRLAGGSEADRREFAERLLAGLAQRGLWGITLSPKECRNHFLLESEARLHDLVLVDGAPWYPALEIRLGDSEEQGEAGRLWTGGGERELRSFIDRVSAEMTQLVVETPVWACILIGGRSSRMGRPKHLIKDQDGRTWLEKTVEVVAPLVDGLVVSGQGELPRKCADLVRLPDIPGVVGPLTGILSACRWQPQVSWLLLACDMPYLSTEAIRWLLAGRSAGCWGRVPRLSGSRRPEPLLAWYDFRAAQIFENQAAEMQLRIGAVAGHEKIANPVVPAFLAAGWQNLNSPDQLGTSFR